MATNLRLQYDAEQALRAESARTGHSQQELIRAAVDQYLGLSAPTSRRNESDALLATGAVSSARTAFVDVTDLVPLPPGVTSSLDLLEREDRY